MTELTIQDCDDVIFKWSKAEKTGWDNDELGEWLLEQDRLIYHLAHCAFCSKFCSYGVGCSGCPIPAATGKHCATPGSIFDRWIDSENKEKRKSLAREIVQIAKDAKVKLRAK